ncbi:MAG: hypothetical protein IJ131_09390 [Eggerthellaceae bacterium]|nr:hypothetical protein [Eggerthellaceae bacterium]
MQFSRGAREAVMFIRSAVDNPEVKVIATCSLDSDLDDFFEDLLGPLTSFTIELPNEEERSSLWNDVFSLYPSLRALGSDDLVRLSANLSRHEIYFAAREAVESAFRHSIERRIYVPVTRNDLYDRIASFQPMNSDEYRELEDCLDEELRLELDDEDVLKGLG